MTKPNAASTLETQRKKRNALQQAFEQAYDTAETFMEHSTEPAELECHLDELKARFDAILTLDDEIEGQMATGASEETLADEMKTVSDQRTSNRTRMMKVRIYIEKTREQKKPVYNSSTTEKKTALLPKIKLPTFDGEFTRWKAFWDTIEADVINAEYADITKFIHIVGQLSGAALNTVVGIDASAENLQTLVDILKDRYGQPRKIIRAHVNNLLDTPTPSANFHSLNEFYNKINGDLRSIAYLGVENEKCAAYIVPIIERKLPKQVRDKMGTSGEDAEFNLRKFMSSLTEQLDNLGERAESSGNPLPASSACALISNAQFQRRNRCPLCALPHSVMSCKLTVGEKFEAIKRNRLCFNCLSSNHSAKACSNAGRCRTCGKKHHSAIHGHYGQYGDAPQPSRTETEQHCSILQHEEVRKDSPQGQSRLQCTDETTQTPETATVSSVLDDEIVLLETGKVGLSHGDRHITAGCLIDRGSMLSYLRREAAVRLRLPTHGKHTLFVNGFGGHTTRKEYDCAYVSVDTTEGVKTIAVLITDQIVKPIRQEQWARCLNYDYIRELPLANDFRDEKFVVDLLIGCDCAFLENRMVKGDGPTVQHSNLGCFVSGPLISRNCRVHGVVAAGSLDVGETPKEIDEEAERLDRYFQSTPIHCADVNDSEYDNKFKRDYMDQLQYRNGQYFAPLPWRLDHPELNTNLEACNSRIRQVMHRLKKLDLVGEYVKVMRENIEKGYISELDEKDVEGYFMPHFPVLRNSATTPVRIVFDASCGSPSLNECLYEGPNMIRDLTELLLLFRTRKIALTDIARAFLCIRLKPDDRKFVKFLWYKNNDVSKSLVPYCANTIIFGNVSSPFTLAITLQKHLEGYRSLIASDVMNKLYVDNLLTGVDSEAEALRYYHEAREIMQHGSFTLRQWASNCPAVNDQARRDLVHDQSDSVTIFGLKWDPITDTIFLAGKQFEGDRDLTKRTITSRAASIFDPLGLIAPLTVPAKRFINKLWVDKDWDDHLNETEKAEWTTIQQSLVRANNFRLPRWLGGDINVPITIMTFCDACPKTAIGCVAYAIQGEKVALLGSKNRVISQKKMAMGARYAEHICEIYRKEYPEVKTVYASDSEIALHWLKSNKTLPQFVKNRVDLIRAKSEITAWAHVQTKENAADILSRGATVEELQTSSWLTGPDWLKKERENWPLTYVSELNVSSTCVMTAALETDCEFAPDNRSLPVQDIAATIDVNEHNNYNNLLRVTALVNRAFKPGINNRRDLSAADINTAEHMWIRSAQRAAYRDCYDYLAAPVNKQKKMKCPATVSQLGFYINRQ
ncbi:uncharacterized protein LOC141898970 [Tubulanus polymorphus]|uniref:uncharacterized protein LOC141898970 n=1 Tax=Tubulanus polymorphus TaxID=672921 RepID=UPI003DA4DDFC